MPELGDSAWKILTYLMRRIDGEPRHRAARSAVLSLASIMEGTRKSRNTVRTDLGQLAELGVIRCEDVQRPGNALVCYRIELRTARHAAQTATVPEGVKI